MSPGTKVRPDGRDGEDYGNEEFHSSIFTGCVTGVKSYKPVEL